MSDAWKKLWGVGVYCKDRLLLHHLIHPNAPAFDILKLMLVVALVLLIDKGTKNPDSVTSTFIAMLCIAPLTSLGLMIGKDILISSMIGTLTGSVVSAICWVDPSDGDYFWWLIFKVPLAVGISYYILLVAGKDYPGAISSCLFSAMFVNVLLFSYPPLSPHISNWPRHQVLSTLLVRILAILTALISATLVNFTISFWAKAHILKTRLFFIENVVWRSFGDIHVDPVSPAVQSVFPLVTGLIADARRALKEEMLLRRARNIIKLVQYRARVLFCVLHMHSVLCILANSPQTEEEHEALEVLSKHFQCIDVVDMKEDVEGQGEVGGGNADTMRSESFNRVLQSIPSSLYLLVPIFQHLLQQLEDTHMPYEKKPSSIFWGLGFDFLLRPNQYTLDHLDVPHESDLADQVITEKMEEEEKRRKRRNNKCEKKKDSKQKVSNDKTATCEEEVSVVRYSNFQPRGDKDKIQYDSDSESSSFSSTSEDYSSDEDEVETKANILGSSGVGGYVDSDMVKIPEEVSIFSSQYHWCQSFGPLTEALQSKSISLAQRAELMRSLATLEAEFVRAATMYGKVIICERFLPNEKKTIPPINVGGKAGGIKYVIEGILFKFAWDSEGIYGGDLKAMKCASHELKSLREIYMHLPEGLRVPLMVSIDYRGFKLLAMCLLPVSKASLIYGSDDGGQTVRADDEIINKKMEELGRTLNLKRHQAGGTQQRQIYMPADIEVHRGMDGKYYMLDFARLWPPELPTPGVKASFLIRLLRGELVQGLDKPLCSDAFSQFQTGADLIRRENNQEVVDALIHLLCTLIPSLVRELEETISDPIIIEEFDIASHMHDKGVNMRHLGMLYAHFKSADWRRRILTEASVRVAKTSIQSLMRKSMKTIQLVSDEPYNRVIVGFLNFLCGNSTESRNYWNKELRWTLQRNFFYMEDSKKALKGVKDIKGNVYMWKLFNTLLPKLGITAQPELFNRVHRKLFFERATIMDERDILHNSPIVDSGLAEHPKAFLLYEQAFYQMDTPEQAGRREGLLLETIRILKHTAVRHSSDHMLTFQYWSKALIALSDQKFKECLKDYVEFAKWMIENKAGECQSDKLFFEFLMDYFWMLLAVADRMLHQNSMYREDVVKRGWKDHLFLLDKFQHPALLALLALPDEDLILSKGIPFVRNWLAHKGKFALEEGEGMFDELHLLAFRWVEDEKFLELADWLCGIGKRGKLKTLRLHQTDRITQEGVYAFLDRMECKESLECYDHSQIFLALDPKGLCEHCPSLHTLILYSEQDDSYMTPDWLSIFIDGMPNLTHLGAFLSLTQSYPDRKGTLLSRLRFFRCKTPGDLLSGGYSMPSMECLESFALPGEGGRVDLTGAPSLRRLSISNNNNSFSPSCIEGLWENVVQHCPLIEELDAPGMVFTLRDIETLASSSTMRSRLRLLSLSRIHTPDADSEVSTLNEKKALLLLGTQFPNLRSFSLQASHTFVSLLHLFPSTTTSTATPPPPVEVLNVPSYTVEEWVKVFGVLRGSLKTIQSVPDFSGSESLVDAFIESLPPGMIHLSMLGCASLSMDSLKRILSALPKLERVGLPCSVAQLQEHLIPFLPSSVREVSLVTGYNAEGNALHWDRVYQMRREPPLLIQIKGSWDSSMKVKSTRALGTQYDTIDPFDSIACPNRRDNNNRIHLLDCLYRIQRLEWHAHRLYSEHTNQ